MIHTDGSADRLWHQCKSDRRLRWLVEGVLSPHDPAIGRMLLMSPVELFGEVQVSLAKKLSLKFWPIGLPYISGNFTNLYRSLKKRRFGVAPPSEQEYQATKAIPEWQAANALQAQQMGIAAILETVRRNPSLQTLTTAPEVVTRERVAQVVPELGALDWQPMEQLFELFVPFLARSDSKKPINRFTLNLTGLLPHVRPEITLEALALMSAHHFVRLLKVRRVSQDAWRTLLLKLIDLNFVTSLNPIFLWCRKFTSDGFAASTSVSWGASPPRCPWCCERAHAVAGFAPHSYLREAMMLKDGLLGAAIGWQLTRRGIPFAHGHSEAGTEFDFLAKTGDEHLLVECKVLSTSIPTKQLLRNVREAIQQLDRHDALLVAQGRKLRASVSVLNLTKRRLLSLREHGLPVNRVLSYEQFTEWLRAKTSM